MFKKLKDSDHVTINDKRYIVTKACNSKIACTMCQKHNKNIPCAPEGQVNNEARNSKKCKEMLMSNHYLKPDYGEKDKKSGT